MEVEPGSDRLDLHVVFDNVHRRCECRSSVKVIGAKINEAILHTEADVARHLVLKPRADRPSVVPIANGKAIRQGSIPPRHVDLGASPSSLGIDKPLIGPKAQMTSHCRDSGQQVAARDAATAILIAVSVNTASKATIAAFVGGTRIGTIVGIASVLAIVALTS